MVYTPSTNALAEALRTFLVTLQTEKMNEVFSIKCNFKVAKWKGAKEF
jgi:hypothetical protein